MEDETRAPEPPAEAPAPAPAPAPEEELTLGSYFGGYAIIFIGVVGLALALVGLMKILR